MPLPRSKTSSSVWEIVGGPEDLTSTVLPTCRDVVKCFNLVFTEQKVLLGGKDPSAKDVALTVALRVKDL